MKFKQDKKKMTLMVAPVLIKHTKFLVHATKKMMYPNISESFLQFRGLNLVCWMVRVIIKEFLLCVWENDIWSLSAFDLNWIFSKGIIEEDTIKPCC